MSRARKRHRSRRGRTEQTLPEPPDPLEDLFESGGVLFLAVGYTPGGAPFGPRVEIVDGDLVFPDEADPHPEWNDRPDDNPF